MTAVRKLKPKPVNIVSLEKRARALIEDLLDAPVEEQIATLEAVDQMLGAKLDVLAEQKRSKGELKENTRGELVMGVGAIPASWVRRQWDIQGRGHLLGARAYFAALKT
jgi:hypothetical protein